ncbi:MAG TPA: bifunctional metallophosphatase/5'-nucleotidase [Candidatus Binatia bacterium]|nr:bifunctional metallophosphatase/5'-nucleotidase [Candidatus Binatia bacterium]
MQKSKEIYVDMDDVLCETARRFLVVIDREFGKQIAYDRLTDFDFETSCGLTPAERAKLYEKIHYADEILAIEPIPEAIDVLHRWTRAGYQIAIVTGRPPDTYASSVEWLARFQVPYHSFTIVDKYGRFETENTVGMTLTELATKKFCWAVEDSLPMAKFLATSMNLPVALLDRPWNQDAVGHENVKRYSGWKELLDSTPLSWRVER